MFVPHGAERAAVSSVTRAVAAPLQAIALAVIAMLGLSGCTQGAMPLLGPDPADPFTKTAGVTYRSTTAPYTSLRPASPSGWREQNQGVAPPPGKSE